MKKSLQVLILLSSENLEIWNNRNSEVKKHFKIDEIIDRPRNITNYLNRSIDILLMDNSDGFLEFSHYKSFRKINQLFLYILFSEKMNVNKDIENIQNLVDRIVYTKMPKKHFSWMIISAFRRYLNVYCRQSKIIYKSIYADFFENKYLVNKKKIFLTPKEAMLLKLFLINKQKFITKNEIFRKVWGFEEDNTRTVDQTLFKLKKKIGPSYFFSLRNKGVKFK